MWGQFERSSISHEINDNTYKLVNYYILVFMAGVNSLKGKLSNSKT